MLGDILKSLTNPAAAEAALLELGNTLVLNRVRTDAQAEGTTAGAFAARAVRHVLDHAGEEIWLDLLGAMARTPEPGAAALRIILATALPDSVGTSVVPTK
jgi:NADPH:quinone reductase-like Zn-dependent oxidoreductase